MFCSRPQSPVRISNFGYLLSGPELGASLHGDYFSYVDKGDKNCGCKPNGAKVGALTIRTDDVTTYYKMIPPAS